MHSCGDFANVEFLYRVMMNVPNLPRYAFMFVSE